MSEKSNFQEEKKSHWQSYESKDRKDLKEVQNQEFFTSPDPIISRIKTGEYDRKTFLKLMGASTAMLTVNCLPQKPEKIVPYVDKPEYMTPGLSNYYASTCGGCSAGCGTLVKTKDGRPLKLEGNPNHPLNKGSLCAQGQASLLNLYDPDRAQTPLKIENGNGSKLAWKDLDDAIKKALTENPGKTRILTAPINSPGTKRVVSDFLSAVGGGKHYEYDAISPEEAIAIANEISYGKAIVPNYRFDKAKVILSLDADFLGTWISPVEFSRQFSSKRQLDGQNSKYNQLIMVDTMLSVTSSVADVRIPVRPGDVRRIGLGIAKAISELGGSSFGQLDSISVSDICKELDIQETVVRSVAKLLWDAKGESLVVGGGTSSQTSEAIDLQILVNLLNSQLDNDGKAVDSVATRTGSANYSSNLKSLEAELNSGEVGVLFIYDTNLLYQLPETSGWDKLLSKAKMIVSLSDRLDETSKKAHYLAPTNHFLESWGDRESVAGVISIQQPTIQPLFSTRSLEDSFINWAGGELSGSKSYYEYLKSYYSKSTNWVNFLRGGTLGNPDLTGVRGSRGFKGSITPLSKREDGMKLALYTTVALGDGKHANNSVLQELPDPVTKVTWDNFIALSPSTAANRGIQSNDVLKVRIPKSGEEIILPAQIQPGLNKDTIAIAIGYGRTSVGKVGNGVGKNSFSLATYKDGKLVLAGQIVEIEKTGKKYKLATTQEHHMMNPGSPLGTKWHDRPLIQHTNLVDYMKNPESGKAPDEFPMITDKSKSDKPFPARGFNPEYEYKGYRWGMSIDLTACTGCSACVVACHIENNIPVVGRDEVRVGREMHWIRIDRYYIGDSSKPETIEIGHQPVMCQHCENAPCETVCPVAATTHSSEGTNDMVYNRCVGTRYCSNNCPYKVRRYNWMEHWRDGKDMARSPRQLAFNPEVTVRSRGVMEKCTFCSSRVAEKKIRAKNEGRLLKDGELKSACQETCPTDAIFFGNINDKDSKVTMKSNDPRSYRILDFLNVKPQVAYLTRVRNYVKESV
ncbi:MAG: 4Fe-4S dicluster domain-containing protein [Leptospiraceae bacterium]|nr:4Fe-4S dicluster domain-containing protein [Leptospiraceae bacterium]MCP5511692.1 4Fe-4S dicluster domain-containing protein [Leptospiraceae bacterium]